MIQIINPKRYRVAEYVQLLTNASKIIDSNDPSALKVLLQQTALSTAVVKLDGEYKIQSSSTITAKLAELDERRDNAFTGILRVVSGFALHFNPVKREAARRIGLIFDKYGSGVTRLRYQQETGEIRSLVDDLLSDAAATSATAELGLIDWVEELSAANQDFDAAYVQRSQEMAGESSQVTALRATAQEKWEELSAHLTAHATLTPSPLYTKTIAEINSLIDDYKTATAGRKVDDAADAAAPPPLSPPST